MIPSKTGVFQTKYGLSLCNLQLCAQTEFYPKNQKLTGDTADKSCAYKRYCNQQNTADKRVQN